MDDGTLIANILRRDRKALATFYRAFQPKLLRFIAGKVNDQRDCDEILQDTLYAFLEAIRDFHGKSNLQTFLFAICQHKIIDFYRRKRLKQLVFSQAPQLEAIASTILNPEEELDLTMLKEKIHRVLSMLLPRYRRILSLKYLEGESVDGIAKKLTITFKSAESQLFRARRAFVELFLSI